MGRLRRRLPLGVHSHSTFFLDTLAMNAFSIDRLSLDERLRLLEELWDSLLPSIETMDIPQSHKDELERRIAAHEADPEAGSTWEEVRERLRLRLGEAP